MPVGRVRPTALTPGSAIVIRTIRLVDQPVGGRVVKWQVDVRGESGVGRIIVLRGQGVVLVRRTLVHRRGRHRAELRLAAEHIGGTDRPGVPFRGVGVVSRPISLRVVLEVLLRKSAKVVHLGAVRTSRTALICTPSPVASCLPANQGYALSTSLASCSWLLCTMIWYSLSCCSAG